MTWDQFARKWNKPVHVSRQLVLKTSALKTCLVDLPPPPCLRFVHVDISAFEILGDFRHVLAFGAVSRACHGCGIEKNQAVSLHDAGEQPHGRRSCLQADGLDRRWLNFP